MTVNTTVANARRESQSHTAIAEAIDWLQAYIDGNPYTDAAKEARNIINRLRVVPIRPALDELLALIGQIAKSDQGLQEITKAKLRMSQTDQEGEKHENKDHP